MSTRPIAVYGATGHTGRLVVADLAARGQEVVLAGRNCEALHALADELDIPTQVRVADLDDPDALRTVTEDATVVVNCAGPFSRSGEPIVSAALATGCHYLDHSAEPLYIKHLFDTFQTRAHEANAVVIPGMSFYGALADLLADLLSDGLAFVDTVTVAYAVSGWRMTPTSKATAAQLNGAHRVLYTEGAHQVAPAGTDPAWFAFPPPVGIRSVLVDYPAGEVVTIPRHVPTRSVQVLMTTDTFTEDGVFTSENLDAAARAGSAFTIAVEVTSTDGTRSGHLRGHDIYRVGAVTAVEAAIHLADAPAPPHGGIFGAAEVFPPDHFLNTLRNRELLTMTMPTGWPGVAVPVRTTDTRISGARSR